jgi:hypothetical protein
VSETRALHIRLGFERGDETLEDWRERYYRCVELRDRVTDNATRFREALSRIAEWHEVDVNGEYTKREPMNGYDACDIARKALKEESTAQHAGPHANAESKA